MGIVIGITTDIIEVEDEESFSMESVYAGVVAAYGGVPLLIPSMPQSAGAIVELVSMADGLLLPGGRDMDPACYNEKPHPSLRPMDSRRTRAEMIALGAALEQGKPILGICNGMQLLNVYLGGSLYQDIPSQIPGAVEHDGGSAHGIGVKPDTTLYDILRVRSFAASSHHHQGVKRLGRGLRVSALSSDGVVEAIEDATGKRAFLIGVQWHVEREAGDVSKKLLQAFVDSCRWRT